MSSPTVIGSIIAALLAGAGVGYWFGVPKAPIAPARSPMPEALRSNAASRAKPAEPAAVPAGADSDPGLQPYPPGFEGMGVEQILTAEPVSMRWVAMLAWADRVTKEELPRELRRLAALHSAEGSTRFAFHFLLSKWGEREPELTLQSLSIAKGTVVWAGTEWAQFIAAVAAKDPHKAVALATTEGVRSVRGLYFDGIAAHLARVDPKAAQELADRLPEKQKQEAMRGIAGSIPLDLATLPASELLNMDKYPRSVRISRWIEDNPAAVTAWAGRLTGPERDELLVAVAQVWAGMDAAAALAWSGQNLPPAAQDQALPAMIKALAEEDPAAATQWITSQPPTEGAKRAMDEILKLSADVRESVAWVHELPPGELRDHSLVWLSGRAKTDGDYAQAIDIAVSLPSENPKRLGALEGAFMEWFARDEKAARGWFSATKDLTTKEREVLGK